MQFRPLATLAILFWSAATFAQAGRIPISPNELTLTVGLHHGYFRDANYSPLHHVSLGPRFGLKYQRGTAGGHRYHVSVGATLAKLTSSVADAVKADRYLADISFGYQRGFAGNTAERQFFVGANYRSYLDISLYDGSEAVTWFALHGFEGAAAGAWQMGNKHRIRAEAAVPFFGLLSRPPYTGWDKFVVDNGDNVPKVITRGDWTSLNNFFGLRTEFGYSYTVSDRWRLDANYGLSYYSTKRLDAMRSFNNSFSLSTTHQF